MKQILITLFLAGCLLTLFGCSAADDSEDMEVDIRGDIAEVHRMDAPGGERGAILGAVLIDGAIEADTRYDLASMTITNETAFYEKRGQERVRITFDDVAVGQRAEARFAGPVKETYPLQGTAAEIIILVGG